MARIISALFRVDAEVPPLEALYLARRYLQRQKKDQPTDGLDRYVALKGWTLTPGEQEELRARGILDGVGRLYVTASDSVAVRDRPQDEVTAT